MSRVFEDFHLEFSGKRYTIKHDRVLPAIAVVESVVTMAELVDMATGNKAAFRFTQISEAYAKVLRFAGADVDNDEVYAGMFGTTDGRQNALGAVQMLLTMMMPQSAIKEAETKMKAGVAHVPKKDQGVTGGRSSRKRSRQRSVGVSSQPSSGPSTQ